VREEAPALLGTLEIANLNLMMLHFRSAQKYDEVATLEENLKELREEYCRQQQERERNSEREALHVSSEYYMHSYIHI
jgi:hypothetical protein